MINQKGSVFNTLSLHHHKDDDYDDDDDCGPDDEVSKISLNTDNISKFSTVNIYARDLASPANEISVSINDSKIGNCKFTTDFTTCSLPFNFTDLKTNIISLRFTPKIIRSPQDLGISEDTRNLGFGMKSISFSQTQF